MQVKTTKDEELNKHFEVTIPSKEMDSKVDQMLLQYGQGLHIKGFRPGKAPLKILRQQHGRRVLGEVLENTVEESMKKLIEEQDIRPASQPKIEVVKFDEGKDLVYNIEVELIPHFDLKDVSDIKVNKPVANIREEEVELALENVAKYNKNFSDVAKDHKAANGDMTKIDFAGKLADGTEYPGMSGEGFDLELGSGQFIPGFEEQLIGAKIGDKVEVKVKFPAEYQVSDLADKDAIFAVTVQNIQQAKELGVSDELAKKVGFDSLDVMKESIRNKLQSEYENLSQIKLKKNILDELDKLYDFELPEGLVNAEYEGIAQRVAHEKAHANDPGHHHAHDHKHDLNKELDADEREELKIIAQRRVRLGLVLAETGQKESIDISQSELHDAIMAEAQKYPGSEQQIVQHYTKNPQSLEALRAPLLETKVINHILDLVDVKEVVVTPEELAKEDDELADAKDKKKSSKKKETTKKETTKKTSDKDEPAKKEAKKSVAKKSTASKSATKKKS